MNYNAQMKAWAIDRALETVKLSKDESSPENVIKIAEKYCEFTHDPEVMDEEAEGNA